MTAIDNIKRSRSRANAISHNDVLKCRSGRFMPDRGDYARSDRASAENPNARMEDPAPGMPALPGTASVNTLRSPMSTPDNANSRVARMGTAMSRRRSPSGRPFVSLRRERQTDPRTFPRRHRGAEINMVRRFLAGELMEEAALGNTAAVRTPSAIEPCNPLRREYCLCLQTVLFLPQCCFRDSSPGMHTGQRKANCQD